MVAMDFPNSPSVNDTYSVSGKTWKWTGTVWEVVRSVSIGPTGPTGAQGAASTVTGPTGGGLYSYSSTAPSSPAVGDRWIASETGIEYTYYNDGNSSQWVDSRASGYVGPTGPMGSTGPTGATFTGGTLTSSLIPAVGTTSLAPIDFQTGTNLTTAAQGSLEFDGNLLYITGNTTTGTGRGVILSPQFNTLAAGASVASGASFFTATKRPALLAGHVYHFKYFLKFAKATPGTVTFSFSNTATTTLNLNATAILQTQGASFTSGTNANIININATAATTTTSAASFSIGNNANMAVYIEGTVIPTANTRLDLLTTTSAGTVTSQLGSNYIFTDLGAANSGNIA